MRKAETFIETIKRAGYNCVSRLNSDRDEGVESLRLAICDDEVAFREQLREAMDSCAFIPRDALIKEFSDGNSLIGNHFECPFDIIFLDIEMDGKSGLETGQEIRKNDSDVIIIFITSHKQYVFQSFKIEAFDFIVKPVSAESVNDVLSRALTKYREKHHIIYITWQGNFCSLDVSDIISIEGYRRRVIFREKDNVSECNGKLSDFEHRLAPYGFIRCHRDIIVNMNYIRSIENSHITTVFGDTVMMSTRKKQYCLRAYSTFITKYRV